MAAMTKSRDELLSKVAEEEARLASLDQEREQTRHRLAALQLHLASFAAPPGGIFRSGIRSPTMPTTPAEKVRLFRSLFRGRTDVYPTRFISKKANRFGYAPA